MIDMKDKKKCIICKSKNIIKISRDIDVDGDDFNAVITVVGYICKKCRFAFVKVSR
jgi:transposase-like protein